MTPSKLINGAYRLTGIIDPYQGADEVQLEHGLEALNALLASLSSSAGNVYASTSENFTMSAGTSYYSMGAAGTASATRAEKILDAFTRGAGTNYPDYPCDIISEAEYNSIPDKTSSGIPNRLFYDPVYPVANIYLWPVPDANNICYIESLKVFAELTSLSADWSLPRTYERAVKFNLAIDLAAEFNREVKATVVKQAEESKTALVSLNVSRQVSGASLDLPGVGSLSPYNIKTG